MSKLKLPIIIVLVLAALGGGLFFSGIVGGKSDGPIKKHVIEPTPLGQDFVVKLADADADRYIAFNIALQLEPMDEEHWLAFSGGEGGGHGGATEAPGPAKVATYPKFYDAVIEVASTFTADELDTAGGKVKLKERLLARFAEIAETDAAEFKSGAASADPTHVGPPYHVMDVYFTKLVVK